MIATLWLQWTMHLVQATPAAMAECVSITGYVHAKAAIMERHVNVSPVSCYTKVVPAIFVAS